MSKPSEPFQLTAAKLAALRGVSPRAIRFQLQGVMPSGKVFVRGQSADAWLFESLPQMWCESLEKDSRRRGYRTVREYCEADARAEWQPQIPLSEIAGSHVVRAETLRRAFEPTFTRRLHDLTLSEDEFIRLGVEDYCRELAIERRRKGVAISARQWRRIFDRVVERDAGAENYSRLELYLPENVGRRAIHSAAPEATGEFRTILEYVQSAFRDPLHPSPEEQGAFWHHVCDVVISLVEAGRQEGKLRRRLVKFLWKSIPNAADWLAVSPNALRVNLGRKLDLYRTHKGSLAAFIDGRRAKRGEERAEPFDPEQVDTIAAHAVFNTGGRIAQAIRECVENGTVSQPRIVGTFQRDAYSKSYVKRSLRDSLRDVPAARLLRHGKRADAKVKPPLTLEYDGIYSMDCIVADDFTFPIYFWVPDGEGWYTLTRGQAIVVCDFRTLRVLSWALRPEKQYDALTILRTFRKGFKEFGLPKFVLREGGIWRRARIINALAKPAAFSPAEFEFRMGSIGKDESGKDRNVRFGDEDTVLRGLAEVRIQFKEAYAARVKPVERVGGLLQDLMEGDPGYCGRDERRDCPEETRLAKLAVESKRMTPQEAGFYSLDEWEARLGEIIERWNDTPHDKRARRIPGLSPLEAFEHRYWLDSDPPAKLDASCEHLLFPSIPDVVIKPNGVSLFSGKYRFCDAQTGERVGQKVIAFFDPLEPETCTFTDPNMKNPFTVARLPGRNALYPDKRTETAMSLINGHVGALKTRFHVLKSKRQLPFRRNMVSARTAQVGEQIQQGRQEVARARTEQEQRQNKIRRRASELGLPASTLDTQSPEADDYTRMMIEAKREAGHERAGDTI